MTSFYRSRLEIYKKLIYFFRKGFSRGGSSLRTEYRFYFAHVTYFDIMSLLKKQSNSLLDIGGAKGEFCKVLKETYNINCINLDPRKHKVFFSPTVIAVGQNLPFKDNEFDIILCRGLLEHIPPEIRERILNEIYRVLRNDGICRIVIPPWFNPHAGHQIRPFHILPFRLAVYLTTHIKRLNVMGKSLKDLGLYPITFYQMSKLIKKHGFKLISYHDVLLRNHFLTRIPFLREFVIPSVAFNISKICEID